MEEFGPWATFRMLLGNKNAAAKGDIQDPAQAQSSHTTGPSQTMWEAQLGDACREAGGEVISALCDTLLWCACATAKYTACSQVEEDRLVSHAMRWDSKSPAWESLLYCAEEGVDFLHGQPTAALACWNAMTMHGALCARAGKRV